MFVFITSFRHGLSESLDRDSESRNGFHAVWMLPFLGGMTITR
ncbi:hypothetical protein [Methylovulum sp.]|nr:hypothetical protein [Methylovulum sp.]MDD5125422.1 hypothetical protein [Methylovulum sp.]